MDDLDALFFDLRGAPESMFKEQPAEITPPSPLVETKEPPAPTETPAVDFNSDINLEMAPEQIHEVLQERWKENYDDNFAAASALVQEIFHGDDELMNWFAERLGNHANVPLLAYRVHCMLNGARPAKSPAAPSNSEIDQQLADFKPGGKHYDRWLGGDSKLNERRIALYSKRYPGKYQVE